MATPSFRTGVRRWTPVAFYTAGQDIFEAKLDNSGNLVWNTFLGRD